MKLLSLAVIAAVCGTFLVPLTSSGEEITDRDEGIHISADALEHDQATDTVSARGHVVLTWQEATLSADTAVYDRKSRQVTASGHLSITRAGDTVTGETVTIDVESGRGELSRGDIFLRQGNMHITGDSIRRTGDEEFAADRGSYTTCDAPVPSWKFSADSIDMTLDDFATARHVVFYLKELPVLYLPYAVFPVKRDRQSGLLFPRFGWSKSKGFQTDLPYYWAISPSQEATLNLDIQSSRGVGTGIDYRYLRKRGSTGEAWGYLIYDLDAARLRGAMTQSHREIFSGTMNLRSSVAIAGDRTFYTDFGERSGDYNRQADISTISFLKAWPHYALTADLRHTRDYYADNDSTTLQTLPELGLTGVRQRLPFLPLFFDLDAGVASFYRDSGVRGQRLYGFPRLTMTGGIPGYLQMSAYGGVHLHAYNTDNIPDGSSIHDRDGSAIPETGARFSTSLSRVYDIGGHSLLRLRHELVPELSYVFSPFQDQSRLPLYDYSDRIVHRNMVMYSLTSFFGGAFRRGDTTEYRDLSRIRISQGYSFAGSRRDLLTTVDTLQPWTDVILESDTRISPAFQISLDARYNIYGGYLSSAAPGIRYADDRGTSGGISYQFSHRDSEYLEGQLATKLLAPWYLSYATRYSFDRQNFLESVYTAEYRHQCWSIAVTYRDRHVINPGQSVTVNFNLAGAFGSGSGWGGGRQPLP